MSSTILRTSPEPDANPSTTDFSKSEPAVIHRERIVLSEIARLVAERADSEAKIQATFTKSDGTADEEYRKAREGLVEKFATLNRETRAADEKRRRLVTETSIQGQTQAKHEFGSASRKIAAEFDSIRETAKYEHTKAKNQATADNDSALKRATRDHAEAVRPIHENARIGDEIRNRLSTLAAAIPADRE